MELKEEDDNKETPSTQVSKSITIKKKKKLKSQCISNI